MSEINDITLSRSMRIVTGKVNAYTELFGEEEPSKVDSVKNVRTVAQQRVKEAGDVEGKTPEEQLKGQLWYVRDLIDFKTAYIADKADVLKKEYARLHVDDVAKDAVKNAEDPFAEAAKEL